MVTLTKKSLEEAVQGFKRISIIGVGSEIRGDDRVGLYVAEKLKKEVLGARCEVLIGGTTPENLSGTLRRSKPSHVLLIDAASAGKAPGTISIIYPSQISGVSFSTHSFSLETLADYLKQTIGARTIIIGIEPKNLDLTEEMSDEVLKAGDEVIKIISSLPSLSS